MASISEGSYRIGFTEEQYLTALQPQPGAPCVILPEDAELQQVWQVSPADNDRYVIGLNNTRLYLSYDGEPDMHELTLLLPEPRQWLLHPGAEPDTFRIAVPGTPMRLGMSMLRIYPPRVALAPEYGDQYQAWTFHKAA
ncbi:hypothetical protein NDR87_32615 [Nocardia sp. CDC159]|uniref:Uncharacterized protein n=1 Tax=Nocardia pulmonis TaxID=2951408 RepID=A0A9X2IZM3_9NOCA|nr:MULTISPECIES: hypothetical protein [Nocardia]MCM6778237.1 hypothetical protein [Nocardia pulmonis]MCM6791126.1 hypothetical protein [Nocardia sp. CDC159]